MLKNIFAPFFCFCYNYFEFTICDKWCFLKKFYKVMRFYKKCCKVLSDNMLRYHYKKSIGYIFSFRSLNDINFNKKQPNKNFNSATFSKIRNRCVFTGRPTSVFSTFHVSRLKFKKLANAGLLPGLLKSLW
jgi:ribosomal protein S14